MDLFLNKWHSPRDTIKFSHTHRINEKPRMYITQCGIIIGKNAMGAVWGDWKSDASRSRSLGHKEIIRETPPRDIRLTLNVPQCIQPFKRRRSSLVFKQDEHSLTRSHTHTHNLRRMDGRESGTQRDDKRRGAGYWDVSENFSETILRLAPF